MAHTLGTTTTRASGSSNPQTTGSFALTQEDTVVCLLLKVDGANDRTGGSPTLAGQAMTQANSTQKAAASPECSCELWYILNPVPRLMLAGNYQISIPNAGSLTINHTVITGRAKAGGKSALDVSTGSNGTSTNPSPGALVTTQDGDFGVAVCCNGATDFDPATPAQTGFGTGTGTPLGTFDDGQHGGGQQYHLQSTLGSTTLGWTFATSEDWGCVAAYFKEIPPLSMNNYSRNRAGNGFGVSG